jgi:hypothetical protein
MTHHQTVEPGPPGGGASHGPAPGRRIVVGAIGGLLWGVAMRAWMRFISADPEFSWVGTAAILAVAVIAGTALGTARWRRAAGGAGWWRSSVLVLALLGAGGAVMWPSVLLGAAAFARRTHVAVTLALAAGAVGAQVPVLQSVIDDGRLAAPAAAIAVCWYLPLLAIEAWAFSIAFAPGTAAAPGPSVLKRAVMATPLLVIAGMAVLTIGMSG